MAKIEFPKKLKELQEESDLQAPIRDLADCVGEILVDNKLPFFPDYTDHEVEHVHIGPWEVRQAVCYEFILSSFISSNTASMMFGRGSSAAFATLFSHARNRSRS